MASAAVLERPAQAFCAEVRYGVETIASCKRGVEALMGSHGQEFTRYRDVKGPVSPDWSWAHEMERRRAFSFVTARHDERLVGYFAILTSPRTTHYNVPHAFDDTFFLEADYRRGWGLYKFVKYAVERMEDSGADILVVANKAELQDMAPVWKRLGFELEEIRYTKVARRLGGK